MPRRQRIHVEDGTYYIVQRGGIREPIFSRPDCPTKLLPACHRMDAICRPGIPSSWMEAIPAADAYINFGALLDKAQREPVAISKNGRAVAVVMSAAAFEEQQRLKLDLLRPEVRRGLEDLERGEIVPAAETFAALDKELAGWLLASATAIGRPGKRIA